MTEVEIATPVEEVNAKAEVTMDAVLAKIEEMNQLMSGYKSTVSSTFARILVAKSAVPPVIARRQRVDLLFLLLYQNHLLYF